MSNLDPVRDKIVQARISLLMQQPFFGNLATRLRLSEVDWLPTAATDGRNLYYNREFFSDMTPKEIQFVVAHEILHCAFDHIGRTDYRDKKLFNIAADYAVNGHLVRDRIGEEPKKVKCFHDPKYYDMSAEEIYEKLYQDYDEESLKQLGQLLDEHLEWGDEDGEGNGQGSGNSANGKGRPQYSKEELREIRDEFREAMIQAAQAAAGKVPAGIARMIKELTEPKMDWRSILRQQIQSIIKNDFSFMRPNRKGWHMNAILPGQKNDETIDIAVAIDMSGSISDSQAKVFLSEIKGIMESYKDFKIKLWCFDTKVYNEQDFDAYNIDDFMQYEVHGGGGTDFDANWEYMKYNDIVPKKFIMFTDMYPCGSWGDENYCDTVFVGHGTTSIVAPFGETVYFDLEAAKA